MSKVTNLKTMRAKAPNNYRMIAKAAGTKAEIYLYGDIGESMWSIGITAAQFKNDLAALGSKVTSIDVRINSDGGDVFDGRTIYNLLLQHKARKTVYVDGLAASIASLIAMCGDEIIMGDGAFMMVHNASARASGNGDDLRRVADLLDSVTGTLIDTYAARSKMPRDDVKKLMDAESWMPAAEAVANGFADRVIEGAKVAAKVTRPEAFKNLPEQLRPNRAAALAAIARTKTTRT
jgi:ATP-dependent Clp protease protease subunit